MLKEFIESNKSSKEFIEEAVTSASVSAEHLGQSPDQSDIKKDEKCDKNK